MKYRYLIIISFIAFLTAAYQNCSDGGAVGFSSKPKITTSTTLQGNGDSYDGKPQPGDYVRTFPNTNCANNQNILIQSTISVDATSAVISLDNCQSTNFPIFVSAKAYDPDFLVYQSGIFEKLGAIEPQAFAEVLCRHEGPQMGLDIVVKNKKTTSQRKATIYLGRMSGGVVSSEKSSALDISLTNQGGFSTYSSASGDLSLRVADSSIDEIVFNGTLHAIINDTVYDLSLACRRMNSQPVISVSPNALMGHWRMDENPATNASIIAAATGINGSLVTGDANNKSIVGRFGGGLGLDGLNDYIPLNAPAETLYNANNQMTITAWFNRNTNNTDDAIFAKRAAWAGVAGNPGFNLGINDGDDSLMFAIDDGTNVFYMDSNFFAVNAGWNHVAVVFDKNSLNECRIYINGVEDTRQRLGVPMALNNFSNTLEARIGALSMGAGTNFFDGGLDEISYWHRKLSSEEIRIVYERNL